MPVRLAMAASVMLRKLLLLFGEEPEPEERQATPSGAEMDPMMRMKRMMRMVM